MKELKREHCISVVCFPRKDNIPDASKHPDWKLIKCPRCGCECWESELARKVLLMGIQGACTSCAIR